MQPQRSECDPSQLPPRFTAKIDVLQGGCWYWTACKLPTGYGQIKVEKKVKLAHREVYELLVGPIPDDLHIDHLCCNPSCVNPAHMEPVSCRVNVLRGTGVSRVNEEKTHCVNGHEFTPHNIRWIQNARRCRACEKRRSHESYRRRVGASIGTPVSTHPRCGRCGGYLSFDGLCGVCDQSRPAEKEQDD